MRTLLAMTLAMGLSLAAGCEKSAQPERRTIWQKDVDGSASIAQPVMDESLLKGTGAGVQPAPGTAPSQDRPATDSAPETPSAEPSAVETPLLTPPGDSPDQDEFE